MTMAPGATGTVGDTNHTPPRFLEHARTPEGIYEGLHDVLGLRKAAVDAFWRPRLQDVLSRAQRRQRLQNLFEPTSEPEIIIRPAAEEALGFVSQDGYLTGPTIRDQESRRCVCVATRGGERVGYLRLEHLWSKQPYIEMIRVLEPHRRAGVGRALLRYVEQEVAARVHRVLYSSSQADEAAPQAWHRRMGFEECGFLSGVNEGGVGEVFFRKRLHGVIVRVLLLLERPVGKGLDTHILNTLY